MLTVSPFADGSTMKLKAGDTVFHKPSAEEWVVLADTGIMIAWAGWPSGMDYRKHFVPCQICSDAEHNKLMAEIATGAHPLLEIILRENGREN